MLCVPSVSPAFARSLGSLGSSGHLPRKPKLPASQLFPRGALGSEFLFSFLLLPKLPRLRLLPQGVEHRCVPRVTPKWHRSRGQFRLQLRRGPPHPVCACQSAGHLPLSCWRATVAVQPGLQHLLLLSPPWSRRAPEVELGVSANLFSGRLLRGHLMHPLRHGTLANLASAPPCSQREWQPQAPAQGHLQQVCWKGCAFFCR